LGGFNQNKAEPTLAKAILSHACESNQSTCKKLIGRRANWGRQGQGSAPIYMIAKVHALQQRQQDNRSQLTYVLAVFFSMDQIVLIKDENGMEISRTELHRFCILSDRIHIFVSDFTVFAVVFVFQM
jgi:hypothetical protein